jgi:hypothetical protein
MLEVPSEKLTERERTCRAFPSGGRARGKFCRVLSGERSEGERVACGQAWNDAQGTAAAQGSSGEAHEGEAFAISSRNRLSAKLRLASAVTVVGCGRI